MLPILLARVKSEEKLRIVAIAECSNSHSTWQSASSASGEGKPGLMDTVSSVVNRYGSRGQKWQGYDKAESLAEEYREELKLLRTMLDERGVSLPAERFGSNNVELMRFAYTTGLTIAQSNAERSVFFMTI